MIQLSRVIARAILALLAHGFAAPVRAQPVSADALLNTRSNCLTAVAKTVGHPRGNLNVIRVRQTSDASAISVDGNVANATAPWACLTNRQGTVEDVHFKGSEGAL